MSPAAKLSQASLRQLALPAFHVLHHLDIQEQVALELETRNHRQIERVQRDHQRGLPTLRELTAVGRNVQFD